MGKGMAIVGNILACKVCGISLSYVGILLMVRHANTPRSSRDWWNKTTGRRVSAESRSFVES